MKRDECNDPLRRRELRRDGRKRKVVGLASVEVIEGKGEDEGDLPDLLVTFVGGAPPKLSAEHFRITGGRKPRPPQVAAFNRVETIGGDDRVRLSLTGEHDHSVYTLHLSTPTRPPRVDPRHDRIDFVFDLACPPVDCAPECGYEDHPALDEPDIDYLAKDYGSFRRLMLDRLSLLLPEWTERHEADLGIMLVELLAHVGDRLSYQQDAVATEAYVGTARKRISIRRHARLVDYVLHEGCNARAFVCLSAPIDLEFLWSDIAFATWTREQTTGEIFLPIVLDGSSTLRVRAALGEIEIYDWDGQSRKPRVDEGAPPLLDGRECCLRRGATSATLVLASNLLDQLVIGDFLIFEEVLGPRTGRPSDADPTHRHVVRLTKVETVVDPLEPTTHLVEVHWGNGDALPFDLCLSTVTTPPACRSLRNVSVARGNVVLVDHGRWTPEGIGDPPPCDPLGVVPLADVKDRCDGPGHLCDEARTPGRFRPALTNGPITHRAPLPSPDPCLSAANAVNRIVIDERIQFEYDSAAIKAKSHKILDELVKVLTDNPHIEKLDIVGYTSSEGKKAHNDKLSADRAASVMKYLVEHGIADGRLTSQGKGPADPVESNDTEAGRIANRRVEFHIINMSGAHALSSAHALLMQDPRVALPEVQVFELDPLGRGELLAWTPRQDLLRSGPADAHFVVEVDDDGRGWLRFGDGELGRHPKACSTMTVRHRVGSGTAGNVGRDMITHLLSTKLLDGVEIVVRNPLPARGGTAPEPLERAREQLAVPLRNTLQRAITAADYETIAEREVPGLQNASADLLWNGSWYEAHVALDPLGHAELDDVTRCRTERVLERARRIGHDLHIGPARTVPLRIALHVCVEPKHLRASVRTEVLAVLGRGRLRDGTLGYFHPDRLSFGEPVKLSRMLARVAAIPGVAAVRVERFERLFEGTHGELERGYIPLSRSEIARLDNDPVHPENGILDVEVEGGR